MSHPPKKLPAAAWVLALAAGAALGACGGGVTAPAHPIASGGFAVDGYLAGSTVTCDLNGNGVADSSETSVTTDSGGGYTFPNGCGAQLLLTGGTSIDTHLAFGGRLLAPGGTKVISALTTLMADGMTQAQVIAAFGLPAGTDILNSDPAYAPSGTLVNGQLMLDTAVAQVLMQQITQSFLALGGASATATAANRQALYAEVAAAMAGVLGGSVIGTATTLDPAVIASVVKAAAQQVVQANDVLPAVTAALARLNGDSLGQVVAVALTAQGESILGVGTLASAVTAATLAQQTDTALAAFLVANAGSAGLTGAPSAATTALSASVHQIFYPPGDTGNCNTTASNVCIGFDGAVAFGPFGGLAATSAKADPLDAANFVLQTTKHKADPVWAGVTLDTSGSGALTVTPINLALNKTITLRSYSPAAGVPVLLKAESSLNGGIIIQALATTTKADAWETLTFDFSKPNSDSWTPTLTNGGGWTLDRISVFPDFGNVESADRTFLFDELSYTASQPAVFASGFTSTTTTAQGGVWGFFSGNFTSYLATYTGGGFADSNPAFADASQYFYISITTSAPSTGGYVGMYVTYPGSGLSLTGQQSLKINLGVDANFFQQASNNGIFILVVGATVYGNGAGGNCQLAAQTNLVPTSSNMTTYTIPFANFTLAQNCNGGGFTSGVTNVAGVFAQPIGAVNSQLNFPNINTTINSGTAGSPVYATGITRGMTWFQ
jgi:hypothetical protein